MESARLSPDIDPEEAAAEEEHPLSSSAAGAPSEVPDWPSNRADAVETAEAFLAAGRACDAVTFLEALIADGRAGLLARLALVKAKIAANDASGAIDAARETVSLYPGAALAALALGRALLAAHFLPAAIGEFQRASRIDPNLTEPQYLLGAAWLEAGEAEKALAAFAAVLPDAQPELAAKIAEAEALRSEPRANARYVRHLFDQFSADYDRRMLEHLRYAGHTILRQLANLVLPVKQDLFVLDLGCGTGLVGEAFRDIAARLDGVDLSPAMIAKAGERGIYEHLAVADIEFALAQSSTAYDLILAADTLVYLGDLGAVFAGAARALKPGGAFLFTVERSEDQDFSLGPKRRWHHSESYIRGAAACAGLDLAGLIRCSPRTEAGRPVEGLAVALTR